MNILLIHPPNNLVYQKFQRMLKRLPIGLAYIVSYAIHKGFNIQTLDAESYNYNLVQILNKIKKIRPDVIGFTCTTPLFPVAIEISGAVKKEMGGNIRIILGGPHISALPRESLFEDVVDFVIFGEGEITFVELLEHLEQDKIPDKVLGLGYKNNGKIYINPPRPLIKDLDSLPFPDRNIFPKEKYIDPINYDGIYTLFIISRGCVYNCIFCGSNLTWGRKVRFRSAQNILSELEEVYYKHKISNVTFCDDTFTLNKELVSNVCKMIIERNIKIRFFCSSRVDTVDAEKLIWLKKAGCKCITFGIESGNEKILKVIGKNFIKEKIRNAIKMVKDTGIGTHASYIIGLPGDNDRTIKETVDFALELNTDQAQFCIATPFPKTELWKMAIKNNRLDNNKIDYLRYRWYYSVVGNLSQLPDEALIDWQKRAYEIYHNRKN